MRRKVYFAGSIRGGRKDAGLYRRAIAHLNQRAVVLTEQVGDLSHSLAEQPSDGDRRIYLRDISLLRECDFVIAECTVPSLGVGYELAYAERLGKPAYVFYRPDEAQLSAMIRGDPYFTVIPYASEEELYGKIDRILENFSL